MGDPSSKDITRLLIRWSDGDEGALTLLIPLIYGRRTQISGSLAQTGLPNAIISATYDAGNELTNWNGTPISHGLNGNTLLME